MLWICIPAQQAHDEKSDVHATVVQNLCNFTEGTVLEPKNCNQTFAFVTDIF